MNMIRRWGTAAVVAGMCLLCAPWPAAAQDTLSVVARLVMRQPAGVVLRLNAGGEQVTGVLDRVTADHVYLAGPARVIPLSTVTDAWLQGRSTKRGGKVGALIGAAAGTTVFALGALVLAAGCEYECGDFDDAGDVAVAAVVGAAAGAASGYLVGALLGASVPRWERLTETSARAPIAAEPPRRHPGLSAFNVAPVLARAASGAEGVGAGVSVSYLTQLSRRLAIGPEVAMFQLRLTPITFEYPCEPPGTVCSFTQDTEGSWSAGGLVRVGMGAERLLEPYALLGISATDFGRGETLGGYSAGAGLRYRRGGGRFAVSGEGRWHANFTNSGGDDRLGFYTAGVALTILR